MRVSMVITALLFAGAFGVHARQIAPKSVEHNMTGCLAKGTTEATAFRLTDIEKDARNTFQFGDVKSVDIVEVASAVKLEPHVGHKIAITGTMVADKDFKIHKMKVTAIKMVSTTCP